MAAEPTDATMDEITYKVVNSEQLDGSLKTIADAIRAKGGTSAPLAFPNGMAQAIADIEAGGAGGNYNIESVDDGNGGQILNITDAHGGTEITDGIVVKARDASGYATEADYYLAANGSIPARTFGTGTAGSVYLMANAVTITVVGKPVTIGDYAFSQLKKLTTLNIDFGEVTSVGRSAFDTLSLLNKEISLPKCTSVGITAFNNSPHLSKIILPKVNSFPTYAGTNTMKNCTRLSEVQLGSVGHTFTNLSTDAFSGCTQAGLLVTVFSNGANADNVLTRIRNGATNATIIIKASENTTYGGTAYAAGDTMITSEVA